MYIVFILSTIFKLSDLCTVYFLILTVIKENVFDNRQVGHRSFCPEQRPPLLESTFFFCGSQVGVNVDLY